MGGRFPGPEILALLGDDLRTDPVHESIPAVALGVMAADPDLRCLQDCSMVLLVSGLLENGQAPARRLCRIVLAVHQACATHRGLGDTAQERCVLSGDWLFMHAFKDALAERNIHLLHLLVRLGQVLVQTDLLVHLAPLPEECGSMAALARADCISAARFRISAQIGAVAGGGDDDIENRLADCGAHFGRAWHLVQDLDDFTLLVEAPSAEGLRRMRASNLLAYALASSRDGDLRRLKKTLDGSPDVAAAAHAQAFANLGALDWARNTIACESAECVQLLSFLPPSPYRQALIDAAQALSRYEAIPAASLRSMSA